MTHLAYENEPNRLLTQRDVGMNMSALITPEHEPRCKVQKVAMV